MRKSGTWKGCGVVDPGSCSCRTPQVHLGKALVLWALSLGSPSLSLKGGNVCFGFHLWSAGPGQTECASGKMCWSSAAALVVTGGERTDEFQYLLQGHFPSTSSCRLYHSPGVSTLVLAALPARIRPSTREPSSGAV